MGCIARVALIRLQWSFLNEPLRSGPGLNYPEIMGIEPGVKVRMIGSPATVNENELWQKVRYKPNQTAWTHLSSLLPL